MSAEFIREGRRLMHCGYTRAKLLELVDKIAQSCEALFLCPQCSSSDVELKCFISKDHLNGIDIEITQWCRKSKVTIRGALKKEYHIAEEDDFKIFKNQFEGDFEKYSNFKVQVGYLCNFIESTRGAPLKTNFSNTYKKD